MINTFKQFYRDLKRKLVTYPSEMGLLRVAVNCLQVIAFLLLAIFGLAMLALSIAIFHEQ